MLKTREKEKMYEVEKDKNGKLIKRRINHWSKDTTKYYLVKSNKDYIDVLTNSEKIETENMINDKKIASNISISNISLNNIGKIKIKSEWEKNFNNKNSEEIIKNINDIVNTGFTVTQKVCDDLITPLFTAGNNYMVDQNDFKENNNQEAYEENDD